MSEHLHKSTQELITTIERKDRHFRLAQSIFMALVLITLIVIVSAQLRTLNTVLKQSEQNGEIVMQINKNTEEKLNEVTRRLDCLAVYFNQPNRAELKITDIDKCVFSRDGVNQQFFTQPQSTDPGNTGSAAPTDPAPNTGGPGQPADPAPQPTPTPVTTQPEPEDPAFEILGIPVCVPLTGVCLR